jgi:hypothetical protein
VAYKAQTAVDSKYHLIVAQEVTNAVTDRDQLSPIAVAAKEALDVKQCKAVADMGYAHGKELKACEETGIEPYVPRPDTSANTQLSLFGKERFVYERQTDAYTCPVGATLTFRFETVEKERQIGTIKFWWDQGHFLMRGLDKVRAEFSLSTLAYNIRRVLNVLGVERLLATLQQAKQRGSQSEPIFFLLGGAQRTVRSQISA